MSPLVLGTSSIYDEGSRRSVPTCTNDSGHPSTKSEGTRCQLFRRMHTEDLGRILENINQRQHLTALVDETAEECLTKVHSGFDQLRELLVSQQTEVEWRIKFAEDFCQLVEERYDYEHGIEFWNRQQEDVRGAEEDYADAESRPEFPLLKFVKGHQSQTDRISLHYGHKIVDLSGM